MPIRRAATVMLLRPKAGRGFELFMLRRSARSAFAPDAFVFPGGALEPQDDETAQRLEISDARLSVEARPLVVTALRELFEEAGVLFALDASGAPVGAQQIQPRHAELQGLRERIARGETTFETALAGFKWRLDARPLAPFSHWLTPNSEARRFDTWFFAARTPAGQTPLADADETHDGRWIAPGDALAEQRAGTMHVVYPTIKHLERLAAFESVDEVLAFARSKQILTVAPDTSHELGYAMPAELEGRW
jgi:recombination protein RecT